MMSYYQQTGQRNMVAFISTRVCLTSDLHPQVVKGKGYNFMICINYSHVSRVGPVFGRFEWIVQIHT